MKETRTNFAKSEQLNFDKMEEIKMSTNELVVQLVPVLVFKKK